MITAPTNPTALPARPRRRAATRRRPVTVGSMCTGFGGLDIAVAELFPTARWAWTADDDPHIAKVIAERFPSVANLGDIRTVDWADIARTAPVDVVTAGFPCQDISLAGTHEGIVRGNRSGLWFDVLDAVRALRPGLVFLENVAALRRRGLDTVLAGLAEAGYDTQWTSLHAAEVGAPHRRDRWFALAWPATPPAHPAGPRRAGPGRPRRPAHPAAEHRRTCHRHRRPRCEPAGRCASGQLLFTPTANLATNGGSQPPAKRRRGGHGPNLADQIEHWENAAHRRCGLHARHSAAAADPHRRRSRQRLTPATRRPVLRPHPRHPQTPHPPETHAAWGWGDYTAAVDRWADITGRRPPHPVYSSPRGRPRLDPRFVEWMMGLPPGWVTAVPDLPRTAQLRALGNGVVPQQAAQALRDLAKDAAEIPPTHPSAAADPPIAAHASTRAASPAPPCTAASTPPHPEEESAMSFDDTYTWADPGDTDTAPTVPWSERLLFTPEESGVILGGIGAGWLRRKAAAREIPCTTLGRTVMFSREDLAATVAVHHRDAGTA